MRNSFTRAVTVDVTTHGFPWAVLEGSERLVDWGISRIRKQSLTSASERVEKLLSRYEPDLLVLEEASLSRHGRKARSRHRNIVRLAEESRIPVELVKRSRVRAMFAASGETRHEIALAISLWFPELAPNLPCKRRFFDPEDERIDLFDAVSFALTVLREREWGKRSA